MSTGRGGSLEGGDQIVGRWLTELPLLHGAGRTEAKEFMEYRNEESLSVCYPLIYRTCWSLRVYAVLVACVHFVCKLLEVVDTCTSCIRVPCSAAV